MSELSEDDVQKLFQLTNEPQPGKRSIFRQWLNHWQCHRSIYVLLCRVGGEIIAWAALSNHHGINSGLLGVFVRADQRRKKLARLVLDALLERLAGVCPDPPQTIEYTRGFESVFRPSILQNNFKDCYLEWCS